MKPLSRGEKITIVVNGIVRVGKVKRWGREIQCSYATEYTGPRRVVNFFRVRRSQEGLTWARGIDTPEAKALIVATAIR